MISYRVLVVTNLWPYPADPGYGSFVQAQMESLRPLGVDYDLLFINGRESRWSYLHGIRDLRRRLREKRYDLIHAHFGLSGWVARLQLQVPVVVSFMGDDVLVLIERSILTETDLAPAQGLTTSGGPAVVAEVLNLVTPSLEKAIMRGVEEKDPSLSEQIRNLMFVFEDVVSLDDRSMQRLLREIDVKELALALKAASNEVKNKILGGMSQRASGALKEEMEMLGPARKRDIESAQTAIVAMIRKLEDAGEIVVGGGADDLVV